jgi:hypothetical protein
MTQQTIPRRHLNAGGFSTAYADPDRMVCVDLWPGVKP